MPLAPLPPELREQVLKLCSPDDPDVAADRRRTTQPTESASPVISLVSWANVRRNPGTATVAVVVLVWVVAAASIAALTFTSSHRPRTLAVRPSVGSSSRSPVNFAVMPTVSAPTTVSRPARARPSPTASQAQSVLPTLVDPSPAFTEAPPSPKPSNSPSPKPSKSPSPSPSASRTASSSPSPTPSPSKTS